MTTDYFAVLPDLTFNTRPVPKGSQIPDSEMEFQRWNLANISGVILVLATFTAVVGVILTWSY